jgi:hypothetical protein
MSGEHAKKEMETGDNPTTSHGKASSEESRKKGKGKEKKASSHKSHRSGDKKKKMRKVVYYETDTSCNTRFQRTKPGASHTCAKKTTYIITECIEINVINHQSTYYIAEVLLQNKGITIKQTKDRWRQCRLRNAT